MYRIVISGDNVAIPIDRYVEMPAYVAEGFIEASEEKVPTAGQQALCEALAKYLGEEAFPGIAEGGINQDSITFEPAQDDIK